ncbi:MAG: S41 family peptidase [Planctomycetes bacterium]|nr:S41 family peptidase [Planctomycetota bacterium]
MSKRRLLWILGAVLLVALCIRPVGAKRGDVYSEYRAFTGIVDKIVTHYVDKVDRKKLFEGACRGMLSTLDPHSQFISPDMLKEFNDNTQGEFGGLGIEIDMRGGLLTVITPIKDTPAYRAGVMAGDIIIAIDGETTEGMNLHEAVNKLRGPVGKPVTITVVHEGTHTTDKITITRELIHIPTVEYRMIDKDAGIGYVHLRNFIKDSPEKTKEAIEDLKRQGLKGLVFDLRNNPGGLFPSAVQIADLFLSKGVIVRTRGRNEELVREEKARPETVGNFDLVLLINKGSASASEIVAGAIKDNRRGILVGTQSYGKATVQSLITVDMGEEDGKPIEGALKLTTARYYTPNDISINKKGIAPDFEVDMTREQQIALLRQRRREFLRKQRRGAAKKEPEKKTEEDKTKKDNAGMIPDVDTSTEGKIKLILNNFDRGRLSISEALEKIVSVVSGSDLKIAHTESTAKAVDPQLQRAVDILKVYKMIHAEMKAKASAK